MRKTLTTIVLLCCMFAAGAQNATLDGLAMQQVAGTTGYNIATPAGSETSNVITSNDFAKQTQNADDICGYYYSVDPFSKEASQCEIYKAANGTYEGKVVWIENPKKRDQVGLVFMTGLKYNAKDNEYQGGKIKYPGKSGTYKTYIRIVNGGKSIKMRGYLGISLFGMTVEMKREERIRK